MLEGFFSQISLDFRDTQTYRMLVTKIIYYIDLGINYSDLSRGHLKLWFSKGSVPQIP